MMKFSRQVWKNFSQRKVSSNNDSDGVSLPVPSFNISLLKSLNIEEIRFKKNFDKLLEKWYNVDTSIPDCEGKRYVGSILFEDLENPLNLCIIADQLDGFKEYYHQNNDEKIFHLCCICGAEKIINDYFLSGSLESNILLEDDHVLAFAMSSGKKNMTLTLAKKAFELGRKKPGPLLSYTYSLEDSYIAEEINAIFTPKKVIFLEETSPNLEFLDKKCQNIDLTNDEKNIIDKKIENDVKVLRKNCEKDDEIGSLIAKKILDIPEFTKFFRTANQKQMDFFWQTIKKDRIYHDKKYKIQSKLNEEEKI